MGTRLAKPALDPGIVSRDPEPLIAFYVNVFGLERLDPLTIHSVGTIHKLAAGESILRIMQPESAPQPGDPAKDWAARAGLRYLTLEVVDAAAAAEAVRANGGAVVLEPFELRPGRIVCQAHDPDGNMLEIGQG
jgi:predicted enzyme related to lactoylglutathione lyase